MRQTPGSSSSQAGNASSHLEDLKARKADYEHVIGEMEKHLSVASDGTIVLDVKNAADIHVNPDAFDELSKSLQKVNTLLRINQLQATQVGLKTDFGPSAAMEARITAAGSCPGIDHTYTYWWGHQIDLNECQTQKLIGFADRRRRSCACRASYCRPCADCYHCWRYRCDNGDRAGGIPVLRSAVRASRYSHLYDLLFGHPLGRMPVKRSRVN